MATGFVTLWEFTVRPSHQKTFESYYGAGGDWARLFRKAPGYVATELLNDRGNPLRYVTVDRWSSVGHWQDFRNRYAKEYEALDQECESFTTHEAPLGEFDGMLYARIGPDG